MATEDILPVRIFTMILDGFIHLHKLGVMFSVKMLASYFIFKTQFFGPVVLHVVQSYTIDAT